MDGPLGPDYQPATSCSTYSRTSGRGLRPHAARRRRRRGLHDRRRGQFGLPRDLNVIALFYNKEMFDAARVAYPDDTWDWAKLVEVGKQLTLDKNGDGMPDQWGLYTETTDMENYWSSLVWQAGGDILSADGKTTALDSDQAARGIQFLQDLIWKEKISPDPAIFAETGDAFEQGKAAMEINGSWLVPRTWRRASTSGSPRCRRDRPARRRRSTRPARSSTRARSRPTRPGRSSSTWRARRPRRRSWQLKASVPVNKEVLARPYADRFDGAQVFADALGYAHLKPSFKGYNEFTTTLQDGARRERLQRAQQDRQGGDRVRQRPAEPDPRRQPVSSGDRRRRPPDAALSEP